MAQNLFSSGVSPDYLQALAAAYNQYFPQQQAFNPAPLQQWYGQAPQAPMLPQNMAPSSVVGSLFGQQYPQTYQGVQEGGTDAGRAAANAWGNMPSEGRAAFFGENPNWGRAHAKAIDMVSGYLQSMGQPANIAALARAEAGGPSGLQAYGNFGKESGGIPTGGIVSPGMFGPAIDFGTDGYGGYGGPATGGAEGIDGGRDASGGGDRGTRGGY